jgi:rare lipoprotein A (peptidoglycan hydrolase)
VSAEGNSVTVVVDDFCACPQRAIDLAKADFRRIAPLSRGLVPVVVSWGSPPLPATDTG